MRNNVVKAGETDSEDYEKALERVYQDMMSRHNDPEIIRMREDNKKSLLGEGYSLWVKDILNLLQVYRNSTSDGERRGVWDHKPVMKEILPSYYRRDEVSSSGRQPVVFGVKLLGDGEYLYDHDFWGNISYGYTLAAAGYNDWITKGGARIDDLGRDLQKIIEEKKFMFDDQDEPMVDLGIKLYRKYGDKLTKEDLQREILENREILRRYKFEDMETRSVKARAGEDLAWVAKRNGVSQKDLAEELQRNARINTVYSGINENMSLREGTRINLPQKADRNYAALTPVSKGEFITTLPDKERFVEQETKQKEMSVKERSIFEELQKNNNPYEDMLYKPVEHISENELKNGMRYFLYENQDMRRKQQADEVQRKWYDNYYETEAVKRDEFGKQIEPQSKRQPAEETGELQLSGNVSLSQAYREVARQASPWGVTALQKGLNSFEDGEILKEDGVLGQKTASRMKEALSRYGLTRVKQSIGYGGLATNLENSRGKPFTRDKLQQTMAAVHPVDSGLFLQKGLNRIGQEMANYENLKEDNEIGEKTTSAFNHLKEDKEEEIKSYLRADYQSPLPKQDEKNTNEEEDDL